MMLMVMCLHECIPRTVATSRNLKSVHEYNRQPPTCTTSQQNQDFVQFLRENRPYGIYTFSQYDASTGTVTDARDMEHDRLLQYGEEASQEEVRWPPIEATVDRTGEASTKDRQMEISNTLTRDGVSLVSYSSAFDHAKTPAKILEFTDYGVQSAMYSGGNYGAGGIYNRGEPDFIHPSYTGD